jgi:hypothetical protein
MKIECHFREKHRGGTSEFLPNTPFKLLILLGLRNGVIQVAFLLR